MSSGRQQHAAAPLSADRSPTARVLERQRPQRSLKKLFWHLLVPCKGHRMMPTAAGYILILIATGLVFAAYSNASNILFMAVSLFASVLLLSLFLALLNFRHVSWSVRLPAHFRVGETASIQLLLRNRKRVMPSYSLWFNVQMASGEKRRLSLLQRLDPGAERAVDWLLRPQIPGRDELIVAGVESMFPFGFLRRAVSGAIRSEIIVWPQRIDYVFNPPNARRSLTHGDRSKRPGSGSELINLREYQPGDPQKMVHWKASARLRQLVVRQIAEESRDGFVLHVETAASLWKDREVFIRLSEFCGSLAEDLFTTGRLRGYIVDGGPLIWTKRLHDLHAFMDMLATSAPQEDGRSWDEPLAVENVISFRPQEGGRIQAYVTGNQAGTA